jgi:hypothetical protein
MRLAVIAALALALCACSNHDEAKVSTDLKDAGQSVKSAAGDISHNPTVKTAEAKMKAAGHEAGKDLRQLGAEAKSATHSLASDTRHASHDVGHHDKDS